MATAESPDEAKRLDGLLTDLEGERELPERVRIVVEVQSAAGVWALRETLAATSRVSGALAATYDVLDLLGRPDNRATWTTLRPPALPETAHLRGRIAAAAMEAGVPVYAYASQPVWRWAGWSRRWASTRRSGLLRGLRQRRLSATGAP